MWSQYSHHVSPRNRDGPGSNKLIFSGTILTIHVLNTPSKTSLTFFFHHWIISTVHHYCLLHQCNKKFPHYSPSFNTHNFLQIAQYMLSSLNKTKKKNSLRMFKTKKPNPIFIGFLFLFLVTVLRIGLKNTTWVCFIRQREFF